MFYVLYLFVAYLLTLRHIRRQMVAYNVEKDMKGGDLAYLSYYPRIYVEGMSNRAKILSECRQCPGLDSNRIPPKYKPRTVSLR
jgi:hypothetical protein